MRKMKAIEKNNTSSDVTEREQESDTSSTIQKTNYEHRNLSVDPEGSEKNKNPSGNKTTMNKRVPEVDAWREIFRKYRIRSIKQAQTTMTTPTTKIQPILIKTSLQ